MAVESMSNVNILSNFNRGNPLPEFSPEIHSQDYRDIIYEPNASLLLRKVNVNGHQHFGLLHIVNGKVKDADNDWIGLPCPPYCNNKGDRAADVTKLPGSDSFGGAITLSPGSIRPNTGPSGFSRDHLQEVLDHPNAFGLLLVNVSCNGKETLGVIGLDREGRILDDDVYKIALRR